MLSPDFYFQFIPQPILTWQPLLLWELLCQDYQQPTTCQMKQITFWPPNVSQQHLTKLTPLENPFLDFLHSHWRHILSHWAQCNSPLCWLYHLHPKVRALRVCSKPVSFSPLSWMISTMFIVSNITYTLITPNCVSSVETSPWNSRFPCSTSY